MGEHHVRGRLDGSQLRLFMKCLLTDLRALETMLDEDFIESGVTRIGAEQELFLVDSAWRPTRKALEVLAELDDPDFTTELGLFNIECNLAPRTFGGDCLRKMEDQLDTQLDRVRDAARKHDAEVVMAGILPTLQLSDLGYDSITPIERYYILNDVMRKLRGGAFEFRIHGKDELIIRHDNVMLEACNTSFQIHFQVDKEEFAHLYNLAQFLSGPVLAACTNSPLLFGRRLWKETRIALFQQAVDVRHPGHQVQEQLARVSFGNAWVQDSVLEIFREDITRFRVLLGTDMDEDPFKDLAEGRPPTLSALRLHNGTIYRWNRPCYGISDGKAHLRIENRYLPAGPTAVDEVANAAFWFGLLKQYKTDYEDISRVFDFFDAKGNFLAAAREGLRAQFRWFGGLTVPAQEIILKELIPQATAGLKKVGIAEADINRYLGVIECRVSRGQTGSGWLLQNLAAMKEGGTKGDRLAVLVAATVANQKSGQPVHEWPAAETVRPDRGISLHQCVEAVMTTDLFTVTEDEVIDLVAAVMDWKHIRHVPVEDNQGRLVGIVSYRSLLRILSRDIPAGRKSPVPVHTIMRKNIITVMPEMTVVEAIRIMRENRVASLPVVRDDRLVGIVTEHDFIDLAARVLEEKLREERDTTPMGEKPQEKGPDE